MGCVSGKYPSELCRCDASSPARPRAVAMFRGLPNGDDRFFGNSPRMGAEGLVGENAATGLLGLTTLVMDSTSFPAGWLYIHVATRTVVEPMMNDGVMRKSNSMTDARDEMIMDRLVAKPFRMLSEYLMTTAVINPPNT